MSTTTTTTTQVYRVYIKATPEAIWDAITAPEWTDRYGYGGFIEYDGDVKGGTPYRYQAGSGMQQAGFNGVAVEGELVEVDPPRRLVQTWRLSMAPECAAEPMTKLTYEIDPFDGGVTRLTITHDLDGAPRTARMVAGSDGAPLEAGGGGWAWVLSDLKSLLETGSVLAG
jgi:uncharacterized protein YndB with AHSA1/START domain